MKPKTPENRLCGLLRSHTWASSLCTKSARHICRSSMCILDSSTLAKNITTACVLPSELLCDVNEIPRIRFDVSYRLLFYSGKATETSCVQIADVYVSCGSQRSFYAVLPGFWQYLLLQTAISVYRKYAASRIYEVFAAKLSNHVYIVYKRRKTGDGLQMCATLIFLPNSRQWRYTALDFSRTHFLGVCVVLSSNPTKHAVKSGMPFSSHF
ncbi:hypothetical protein CHS0354_026020 [Potamilus streckersoni]|uniref:Uncharacterized protein n=1 Tax=Potamilus streckersoni TaxID=2493646 RepID=A0AAE0VSN9_9BIVA|nr:hypothetical protein CHS0354_026020 [Potamilus streckersoni]